MRILFHPLFWVIDAHQFQEDFRTVFRFLLSLNEFVFQHAFHDLLTNVHGWVKRCHRILEDDGDFTATNMLLHVSLGLV